MELKEIELTESQSKYIKDFTDKDHTARVAFQEASLMCKLSRMELWDALEKLYPDAIGKGTTFNHKESIIQYIED